MRIFFFEPDYRGYRRSFLEGLRKHSRHEIISFTLPEGQADLQRYRSLLPFLEKISREQDAVRAQAIPPETMAADRVDALITSDPLTLCELYGLGRQWLAGLPSALYFHEFPFSSATVRSQGGTQSEMSLLYGVVSADRLFFCSEQQKKACLDYTSNIVKQIPDFPAKTRVAQTLNEKSRVIPPGIALRELDRGQHDLKYDSPTILWNHRWEYSKRPEEFFQVVYRLAEEGLDFGLVVCGQKSENDTTAGASDIQKVFDEARHRLGDRIFHFGYVKSRAEYANLLWMSDIVISTADIHYFPTSLIEAAFCDCYPLAPNRLGYPDLFPPVQRDRFVYQDFQDLYVRLKNLLLDPLEIGSAHLRHHLLPYDWEKVARQHDQEMAGLRPTFRTVIVSMHNGQDPSDS